MTLYWGRHSDSWRPTGGHCSQWRDLRPGDLIARNRAIWRVAEVRDVPVVDWDEHDRAYYERMRQGASWRPTPLSAEADWSARPVYLVVYPASGGKRHHAKIRCYAEFQGAWVLPEHYPVCKECGEPWPCPEIDIIKAVQQQAREMEELEAILPGCCWGCGEPVTKRQGAIAFEGENLLLPGAPSPVFHGRRRRDCLGAAKDYEKKWVPAAEGRRWRLQCSGELIVHVDGRECSEDPLCPGRVDHHVFMDHRYGTYDCLRCKDAAARGAIPASG